MTAYQQDLCNGHANFVADTQRSALEIADAKRYTNFERAPSLRGVRKKRQSNSSQQRKDDLQLRKLDFGSYIDRLFNPMKFDLTLDRVG